MYTVNLFTQGRGEGGGGGELNHREGERGNRGENSNKAGLKILT
jgi:hypothetical protein